MNNGNRNTSNVIKFLKKQYFQNILQIKIVSGSGPFAEGEYFNYAWKELKQLKPALIDEHYYKPPAWFFNNASRYDSYERTGPKIFAGEYAAHSKENPEAESRNNWESALAEAAFMTGLEEMPTSCKCVLMLRCLHMWMHGNGGLT